MDSTGKRFRAFISYSQRDKGIARRLHQALEGYRVPAGVAAALPADRRLGRFFRDDDEMGASQSLGAALEGALDDAQALIVVCSPAAARSTWVDAEVRHFKSRGDGQVYAVVSAGQPHASDPASECFAPALKQRIGRDGQPTGEPDEPRAPDLRQEGMARVVAQLAAGLLGVPFDDLWQRDRRRARRRRLAGAAAAAAGIAVLAVAGWGWLDAQTEARAQSAQQALGAARSEVAEGRVGEAVRRLQPHLAHRETRALVEPALQLIAAWAPDPRAQLAPGRLQAVRLRDATILLQPGAGAYDVSDVGVDLQRLIRSRDGQRLIGIGDQRVVVFDAHNRERMAQLDNRQVSWIGQAFEAPSGLIVVTGAILGPTNGSVRPYALAVSADGRSVQSHAIDAPMFWGSAAAVTSACNGFAVAVQDGNDPASWRVELRVLEAGGLSPPRELGVRRIGEADERAVELLSRIGPAFPVRDAFMGEAPRSLFTTCSTPREEVAGVDGMAVLDLGLVREPASRWVERPRAAVAPSPPFRDCTGLKPCLVVGGRTSDKTFARETLPATAGDRSGWLPPGRWSAGGTGSDPVFFEHLVFNSGHQLAVCRRRGPGGACLVEAVMGEDHAELPLLRSPDGRFLYWPFAGVVFDLDTLQPLTPTRTIPTPAVPAFDFDADREGLTIAVDGRLLSFRPASAGGAWVRQDDERASPRFAVLADPGESAGLFAIASLGARQFLALRADGLLVRIDAARGVEAWRSHAAGLGPLRALQLDPGRRFALLVGEKAWRLFRLSDGFPASGLLLPPGQTATAEAPTCRADDPLGADGSVVARCGEREWIWAPPPPAADLTATIQQLACLADVGGSALETIRRCVAR